MSQQRSLEQRRAEQAWKCVIRVRDHGKNGKGGSYAKEYGSLARSAAADIQANGLGQTLAFWRAKGFRAGSEKDGGNEHARLLLDLSEWVSRQLSLGHGEDLLRWIMLQATTRDYRRATAEAIAFLTWVKRFAEAELPREDES